MKALILAAGVGSRLMPLTKQVPKSLVAVNGKPILEKQIDNLYKNGIEDITVVAGYKAGVLKDLIKKKYPSINIIDSIQYETTNNMYSAYLAYDHIGSHNFLMMNADVFFDDTVIKSLIEFEAENAIVTDIGRYLEESMKVVEKDGRLVRISKKVASKEALGTSIDVYKFSAKGARAFFEKCSEFINIKQEYNLWSEVAINDILQEIEFRACPLNGRWFEIDNLEDLEEAEKLFK